MYTCNIYTHEGDMIIRGKSGVGGLREYVRIGSSPLTEW